MNTNLKGNNKYTIDMANIHTCATCGKIFRRKYDLRRHENTVHSEDTSSGEDEDSKSEDSESENEEQSEVETSESETLSKVDLEDNDIYQRMYERSMQVSEPARTEKYEKYVGKGMSEQQAREKAYERTLWPTKSNFFDTYEEFLEATVQLEEDDTHQEIIADMKKKCEEASTLVKLLKEYFPNTNIILKASSNTNRMMRMLMIRIHTVWKMFWISHPRSVRVYFQLIKDIRKLAAQWPKGYCSQRKKLCAKSLKNQ